MQWAIFAVVIAGVVIGTVLYVVDRRAERELRRQELAIEKQKADTAAENAATAAQRAENARYRLATERAKMELDYSHTDRTSPTLDDEHGQMQATRRDSELAAAGIDNI